MPTSLNNIFNFSRSLPAPFDTLSGKKVKVSSIYGNGTEATLTSTVIKAVHSVCGCMKGSNSGAVGVIDHRSVAEYKSSVNDAAYHLVVYDSSSGNVMASVYDKNVETLENYKLSASDRDGAAVMMALMPFLLTDDEFKDNFNAYYDEYLNSFPDVTKATELMAILCDNAYRRVKDDSCSAHLKLNVDNSGNIMRVSRAQLDSGAFAPTTVTAGEFTIFSNTGPATIVKASTYIEHSDFVGKFPLQARTLSAFEQQLVPELPEWYVIPPEVVDICKHAQFTTGKASQMRNFMLRGPAGTGKTMGAQAVAAGLGLPYMKYTCSAGTEIFDFIGQIFPDSETASTGRAELDAERKQLMSMGGINYANVSKLMNLPDLDDIDYDPEGVYKALTGSEKSGATAQDCMSLVLDKVTEKVRQLSQTTENSKSNGQSFSYIETDFIKALKNGYVVEVQEPTTIMQPGVLVGLNSLLEQTGSITLPTGEIIKRHPDAVVIITTNISYEGCRGMNQSVLDRMSLTKDIELPTQDVMVQRVMSITGATDEYQVAQMVKVVDDMAEYCRKNGIEDGCVGMRSLIDWVTSTEITGNPHQSALYTVISKATSSDIDRDELVEAILNPIFPPVRRSA